MRLRTTMAVVVLAATPVASAGSARTPARPAIVFASARASELVRPAIYTSRIRGGGRRRITPNWRNLGSPTWSPTGRWIAFERDDAHTYVVPARGGRPILVARRFYAVRPTWAPNGSALALLALRGEQKDLVVAKTGHWRGRRLARNVVAGPDWLPDGRSVAYSRGDRAIRTVDVPTGARRVLYRARLPVSELAVSPDGATLVYTFTSLDSNTSDLYRVDLRTRQEHRIARGLARPSWSPDGKWVAARFESNVYVLRADGRGRARLTSDGYDETRVPPVWSPDGRLLVTRDEVYAVRPDGRGSVRITHESPRFDLFNAEEASPAPDGSRIAYVSQKHETFDHDLYEVGSRGGPTRALTRNSVQETDPAWSPDGTTLAFTRTIQRVANVAVLRPAGRARVLERGSRPAWSPDGSQIAFERDGDIYVVSASGGGLRAVTTGPDIDSEPDWSPNGQRLVFVRQTSQDQDVWSASAGGTDVRRVTEVHAGHDRCRVLLAFSPAWSPDGSEIAYSLLDGGNLSCALHGTWQSIEAVATDGSGRTRRITDGGRTDPISGEGAYEPTWSPDGTMVAFADVLGEKSRIAVVPRAGGRFRFVTPRSYEAFNPDWRP